MTEVTEWGVRVCNGNVLPVKDEDEANRAVERSVIWRTSPVWVKVSRTYEVPDWQVKK